MDASTVNRTVRTGSSSSSGSSRSSPAVVQPRMKRPKRSSDLRDADSSPTVASMEIGFVVSALVKSGSAKAYQRDERHASAASRTVDFPESPGPIRQQNEWPGFQSSMAMPRKFETLSRRICMYSLSMPAGYEILDSDLMVVGQLYCSRYKYLGLTLPASPD